MKKSVAKKLSLCLGMLGLLTACGGGESSVAPTKKTHNETTHIVDGKGGTVQHNFVDGHCTMCGASTIFRQDPMFKSPDILLTPQANQGHVEYFWYRTRAYGVEEKLTQKNDPNAGKELWIYKRAYIYLPYGYDAEDKDTKYNVVYMMHGNKLNEGYWFRSGDYANESTWSAYTSGYGTENVLDYLAANHLSEKTIYVGMTMYQYYHGTYSGDPANPNYTGGSGEQTNVYSGYIDPECQVMDAVTGEPLDTGIGEANEGTDDVYYKEWQNHLLPYVADHFNTYAASSSEEDMKAARDHVGFTGLSRGGWSVNSVLANSLEYASYFAYESGGTPSDACIANMKAKEANYPVNYCFISCGSQEEATATDAAMLKVRDAMGWKEGSDIQNGDKIEFIQVNGTAHNYATWITNLYNFMLVAFKK